jgi:hypothetical protein
MAQQNLEEIVVVRVDGRMTGVAMKTSTDITKISLTKGIVRVFGLQGNFIEGGQLLDEELIELRNNLTNPPKGYSKPKFIDYVSDYLKN